MKRSPRSTLPVLGAFGIAYALVLPARADAQDTPPVTAATQGTLAEVVVTAQKRAEDLYKVPASISVLSASDIADQHLEQVADLTRSVPNLSFSTQGGEGNQNIELRGISSYAGSSTVAVYLDDVPLTVRNLDTQGQAEPSFFDIERVEVLRGPQGTLYGASSEGGTIRYISNPVNLSQTSGDVYADVSDTKHGGTNYTTHGVLNLPLVPGRLGMRAGISLTSDSGYIDHYNPDDPAQLLARGVNGDRTIAARVQLDWRPSEALDIRPTVLYQRTITNDLNVLDLGSPDLLSQHKRVREPGKDTLVVPSLTVAYDLGGPTLTSVTSYFYRYFDRYVDGTFYNSGYIGSLLDGAGILGLDGNLDGYVIGNVASPVHYRIWTQQFTQEVRLLSSPYVPGGTPLTWIAGIYYSDQKLDSRDYETAPGLNQTLVNVYGTGFLTSAAFLQALGGPSVPVFPDDAVYLQNKLFGERQAAVFGEATYHFSAKFGATVGLRYTDARDSLTRLGEFYFSTGSPPAIKVVDHGNPITPKFGLTYYVNSHIITYLTATKGFRLGGPNRPLPSFCPQTPTSYAADSLWSYETGVKSRLLNDTLSVTGDVFYIDWSKIQVDINLPCTFDYYTNAGNAKSYGSEMQVQFKPLPSLLLTVAAGYTHATLTQDVPALGITAGQDVPGVPRWSLDFSSRYSMPIGARLMGYVAADWNYVGSSHGTVGITDPDYNRPSYAVMGLSGGVNYGDWQVAVFARNVFNDQKIIQRPNLQTVNRGYTLTPRTIGLSVDRLF